MESTSNSRRSDSKFIIIFGTCNFFVVIEHSVKNCERVVKRDVFVLKTEEVYVILLVIFQWNILEIYGIFHGRRLIEEDEPHEIQQTRRQRTRGGACTSREVATARFFNNKRRKVAHQQTFAT